MSTKHKLETPIPTKDVDYTKDANIHDKKTIEMLD
eukprot:CAMPEP_0116916180 /NCGR_PEP_ID=MMETSP0467-20121206/18374_1 /TAXON_ID=283647 /ORGANISM="Mesodinium pulex, Strain SPMC105" /LENGTH=34 /DNA_ID= /DNA_START= /DNA_END= /DNA_ORIENTATION=